MFSVRQCHGGHLIEDDPMVGSYILPPTFRLVFLVAVVFFHSRADQEVGVREEFVVFVNYRKPQINPVLALVSKIGSGQYQPTH